MTCPSKFRLLLDVDVYKNNFGYKTDPRQTDLREWMYKDKFVGIRERWDENYPIVAIGQIKKIMIDANHKVAYADIRIIKVLEKKHIENRRDDTSEEKSEENHIILRLGSLGKNEWHQIKILEGHKEANVEVL